MLDDPGDAGEFHPATGRVRHHGVLGDESTERRLPVLGGDHAIGLMGCFLVPMLELTPGIVVLQLAAEVRLAQDQRSRVARIDDKEFVATFEAGFHDERLVVVDSDEAHVEFVVFVSSRDQDEVCGDHEEADDEQLVGYHVVERFSVASLYLLNDFKKIATCRLF